MPPGGVGESKPVKRVCSDLPVFFSGLKLNHGPKTHGVTVHCTFHDVSGVFVCLGGCFTCLG